jgi:hypothetical protein
MKSENLSDRGIKVLQSAPIGRLFATEQPFCWLLYIKGLVISTGLLALEIKQRYQYGDVEELCAFAVCFYTLHFDCYCNELWNTKELELWSANEDEQWNTDEVIWRCYFAC